jgi:hypothetical protein
VEKFEAGEVRTASHDRRPAGVGSPVVFGDDDPIGSHLFDVHDVPGRAGIALRN